MEYLIVTTIDANNPSNGFLRGSGLSPSYFPGTASVITARTKWDDYRFSHNRPPAATRSFCPRGPGQVGTLRTPTFQGLFAKIPIVPNRVSSNFWSHRISLAHTRCTASNIVHRFHTMKRHVFGPLTPQDLYFLRTFLVPLWILYRNRLASIFSSSTSLLL